jgi:hypothetical protein
MNSFIRRVGLHGRPSAHPQAIVQTETARFTLLTARLVRLEWSPDGVFDDRSSYAFPSRYAVPPDHRLERGKDRLVIDTGDLQLSYQISAGPFDRDNLSIGLTVADQPLQWCPGMSGDANLRGARRTLDNCRGEAALDPGLLSRDGWVLFDDSDAVRFDPQTGWALPRMERSYQDWYFFGYGHDYAATLRDYTRFGGAVPPVPRWILGAWWSRYWAYHENDLRRLVADFAEYDLPLDVLVIDMDWHTPHSWTGYTWNRDLFPDPPAFLQWLHTQGLHTTLNLHPAEGVQAFEEAYPAVARALGRDPATADPIPFQIGDPQFARAYFELLHHPLEAQGVDFWWIDWQQGRTSDVDGLDPLPWLNHLHFVDSARRDERPLIFSRWGGLGNHRYPVGFSGDTFATWEALRFQPYFTATASNVLFGWWSHDIGGHFGACEPELFARWVQAGAFSPILRLHASNDRLAERRPWVFPQEVLTAARAAFYARYELIPYLYTLARVATESGIGPCRPMYYSDPESDAAYVAREQYCLGEHMIVAPIVHPAEPDSGLAPADVWLPSGAWIERSSGEIRQGPAWVRVVGDLAYVPQFVRAGSILPLAPVTMRSMSQIGAPLVLEVVPGADATLRLYEDDGVGTDPDAGEWTPVTLMMHSATHAELRIAPSEGYCPALARERDLQVRWRFTRRPQQVFVDGQPAQVWSYDPERIELRVDLPACNRRQGVRLELQAAEPLASFGDAHNRKLQGADARTLLGLTTLDIDSLTQAACRRDDPSAQHALARLGGPFVRFFEYTTPEDARRRLGVLLVQPPADAAPIDVHGVWRVQHGAALIEQPFAFTGLKQELLLDCPYAWDGSVKPLRWSVELTIGWRGASLQRWFQSRTLFPTLAAWRILARPIAQPYAMPLLIDESGAAQPDLPWELHQHTPIDQDFQNLNEWYNILLSRFAAADPQTSFVGYAAASLQNRQAGIVRIGYHSFRPVRLFLNGVELAADQAGFAAATFAEWRFSRPVELKAGINHLLIISEHPAADQPWRWFLSVSVFDESGVPLVDLVPVVQ